MEFNDKVLKILKGSNKPLGAASIKRELQKAGSDSSEATIGRTLFYLDSEGYTRKEGNFGRQLTLKGREYLSNKENIEHLKKKSEIFMSALDINKVDELLEALEARKIVESQIAKYAARRCNIQAKRDLQLIIESHERQLMGLSTYQ